MYFNENSNVPEPGVYFKVRKVRGQKLHRKLDVAIMLSIYFCYVIRMKTQYKRDELVKSISIINRGKYGIPIDDFKEIIQVE